MRKGHIAAIVAALTAACGAMPVQASKLLYRAYNNDNQLYGAMIFDTNKPYKVDAVKTVTIPTTVFSTTPLDTYLGPYGVSDYAEFRAIDYTASGSNAFGFLRFSYNSPRDSQLFQINPDGSVRFDTGTYHVYTQPTSDLEPTSDFKVIGRVEVTDVTDQTVNIIAQTQSDNRLQFLAISYGDKPASTPLANGGFALTDFEGSYFTNGVPSPLTELEFLAPGKNQEGPTIVTNGTSFRNYNLFTGPNTDPDIMWFMDPTDPHPTKDGLPAVFGDRIFITQSPAQIAAAPAPEPVSWALMVVGFGATGAAIRSNRRKTLVTA